MMRCCLCREGDTHGNLIETHLPGSGFRCRDGDACRQRVANIVEAHRAWGDLVG